MERRISPLLSYYRPSSPAQEGHCLCKENSTRHPIRQNVTASDLVVAQNESASDLGREKGRRAQRRARASAFAERTLFRQPNKEKTRTMVALAMALGALLLGAPHFQESATPALAPKTSETPALQQQQQHATFLPSGPARRQLQRPSLYAWKIAKFGYSATAPLRATPLGPA